MLINDFLTEANVANKIRDEKMKKNIMYAVLNDETIPDNKLHLLGKRPTPDQAVKFLSDIIDNALANTAYGDIAKTNKYDMWLINRYLQGSVEYEDIHGEADNLGAFHALGKRNVLEPQHRDINNFDNLQELSKAMQYYGRELAKLKDEERLKKMKKDKKDLVLINDGEVFVSVPFNYGACYVFNNAFGVPATYCTGSSSGETWVEKYMPQGIILNVFDIQNPNDDASKFQIHAPTNQINSASQSYSNSKDAVFAKRYPGLLQRIAAAMQENADAINQLSQDIKPGGYDVNREIQLLRERFPKSWSSGEEIKNNDSRAYRPFRPGDIVYLVDFDEDPDLQDLEGEQLEIIRIEQDGGIISVRDGWGYIHTVNSDMIDRIELN